MNERATWNFIGIVVLVIVGILSFNHWNDRHCKHWTEEAANQWVCDE